VRATGIEAKLAFLSQPEAYPDAPRTVERIETHMSWVFLTDRHAYKLKKPVRYDSLDFSSLELRRRDCEEEVRLNRRLARDVYLGTLALTLAPGGTLQVGGEGEVLDWLVHMRRLPADRMLDELIRRGEINEASVRPAAERLAEFYVQAEAAGVASDSYRKRLAEGVRSDLDELCRPAFGLRVEQVTRLVEAPARIPGATRSPLRPACPRGPDRRGTRRPAPGAHLPNPGTGDHRLPGVLPRFADRGSRG